MLSSSDRFDFKAKYPTHVVEFLNEPFLFPDHHTGPDLICFLQDEQTDSSRFAGKTW
jgi:hypothetical protein